jgi:hypothetical protein
MEAMSLKEIEFSPEAVELIRSGRKVKTMQLLDPEPPEDFLADAPLPDHRRERPWLWFFSGVLLHHSRGHETD